MSFVRAVRITHRRIIYPGALPPNRPASREIDEILGEHVASSRGQVKVPRRQAEDGRHSPRKRGPVSLQKHLSAGVS